LCGIGTSLTVGLVALVTHMPPSSGPLVELMNDRSTLLTMVLFGTIAAPLFEELAFRGFLQPLLVRSMGAVAGIGLASSLFGALHYSEYGNSWRSALVVGISGVSFGCIRHFTGSTRAAVIAHAAFNALPFLYMVIQGKGAAS
jgi:membrane protease YdiL (CAAX protease family)